MPGRGRMWSTRRSRTGADPTAAGRPAAHPPGTAGGRLRIMSAAAVCTTQASACCAIRGFQVADTRPVHGCVSVRPSAPTINCARRLRPSIQCQHQLQPAALQAAPARPGGTIASCSIGGEHTAASASLQHGGLDDVAQCSLHPDPLPVKTCIVARSQTSIARNTPMRSAGNLLPDAQARAAAARPGLSASARGSGEALPCRVSCRHALLRGPPLNRPGAAGAASTPPARPAPTMITSAS
jgi:hypothetical protein